MTTATAPVTLEGLKALIRDFDIPEDLAAAIPGWRMETEAWAGLGYTLVERVNEARPDAPAIDHDAVGWLIGNGLSLVLPTAAAHRDEARVAKVAAWAMAVLNGTMAADYRIRWETEDDFVSSFEDFAWAELLAS